MKKRKVVTIIIIIAIIAIITYLLYNSNEYKKIKSTNLSKENIGGVYLLEKYNEIDIEKVFGKVTKKTKEDDYNNYEYATKQFVVFLKVDKDNNIIRIAADLGDNSLKTSKGINKSSTFTDVEKSYGGNFLKKKYPNFMNSGNGYWITYVDKSSMSKITFEFNELNKGELSNMSLEKY
ncbi:MAG TPA: hypothetical protein VF941_23675 [Clostridia bacterium]